MDAVIRGFVVYLFLMILIRLSGRRTLGEMTTFDLILLLMLGETTQQALLGENFSLTNSFILMATLIGADIGMAILKRRRPRLERSLDGVPVLLLHDGTLNEEFMNKTSVDEQDILAAARETQVLERLDQVKYAVLEVNGKISIMPKTAAA